MNECVRVKQSADRIFSDVNSKLYFNPGKPPPSSGEYALDNYPIKFNVL